jgi:hypothetical protein
LLTYAYIKWTWEDEKSGDVAFEEGILRVQENVEEFLL